MRDAVHNSPQATKPAPKAFLSAADRIRVLRPKFGTWFRSEITLCDPEGSKFTDAIIAQLNSAEKRKKSLRPLDHSNRFELVKRIAANSLACQLYRAEPHVSYMRKSAFYGSGPQWLNGSAMARTVGLLVRCGLVESTIGKWGSAASVFTPTGRLLTLAEQHNVSAASIVENFDPERLVRLRQSNADGPEIGFKSDDKTEAWAKKLEAFNNFAGQHLLEVDLNANEVTDWVRKLNLDSSFGAIPLRKPELFRRSLYRTFNNGSFEQGGRLYGAWWINAPRSIRPSIKIDGENTIEYDYSGCAIRMLYHQKGIDFQDDPYRLDPLWAYASEKGLEEDHFRSAVKALMQALINSPSGVNPARAKLNGCSVRPFSKRDVIEMIETKHSEIGEAFGSGAGLKLQKAESDLALSIISNLLERGILALPVHDSFRVADNYEKELIEEMDSCYNTLFGFHPLIKKS